MSDNPLRKLPPVHEVLRSSPLQPLVAEHAREQIVHAIRAVLDDFRRRLKQGQPVDSLTPEAVALHVVEHLRTDLQPRLRSVINATGIVLHTNLGRAPVAEEAARAAYEAARGYLNLELDLAAGKRSSRQNAIREWLCRLTGAESATAVNNNAAATVIVLRALCQGKEVILSRGQLIEIGGSFRIPEIMAVSGATLREVGTTNITRLADYERAIGPGTGAIMRIHASNYRIGGFTRSVSLDDLVALGKKHGLPVIDDIGSGALVDFARLGFTGEPLATESIRAGADLVLFSGDKLLGGPQAGLIAGQKALVQQIEKDPLMRAFRLDKMTLAALEATLRLYLNEAKALAAIPVLRMLATPLEELHRRAESLAERLRAVAGITTTVAEDTAFVGGGSLPDQAMPSWVVEVVAQEMGEDELARRLRIGSTPVVGRLREGKLVLDLRTVFPAEEPGIVEAFQQAVLQVP